MRCRTAENGVLRDAVAGPFTGWMSLVDSCSLLTPPLDRLVPELERARKASTMEAPSAKKVAIQLMMMGVVPKFVLMPDG